MLRQCEFRSEMPAEQTCDDPDLSRIYSELRGETVLHSADVASRLVHGQAIALPFSATSGNAELRALQAAAQLRVGPEASSVADKSPSKRDGNGRLGLDRGNPHASKLFHSPTLLGKIADKLIFDAHQPLVSKQNFWVRGRWRGGSPHNIPTKMLI